MKIMYNHGKWNVDPRSWNTTNKAVKTLILLAGIIVATIKVPTAKIIKAQIPAIKIEIGYCLAGCFNSLMWAAFISTPA